MPWRQVLQARESYSPSSVRKALTLARRTGANFGIGCAFLPQRAGKARRSRAAGQIDAASRTHKHLINEFGIALRKNSMFDGL